MLFNEIYGLYYNTVSKILSKAIDNNLKNEDIEKIIRENAFNESNLIIPRLLKENKWLLLDENYKTPIKNKPDRPMTILEKRWLKSILIDKRVKLFMDISPDILEDIKPLFTEDDYVLFDKYNDGDPYESEEYIYNFRKILSAIKSNSSLLLSYFNRKNILNKAIVKPEKLEYSEKDDKFRLVTSGCSYLRLVRLSKIKYCKILTDYKLNNNHFMPKDNKENIIIELTDYRNALERVMIHFSHFEKEAERVSYNKYRIKIYYDSSDRTEMVIRILSFGPFVKVIEPESFIDLIKERLKKQKNLWT